VIAVCAIRSKDRGRERQLTCRKIWSNKQSLIKLRSV